MVKLTDISKLNELRVGLMKPSFLVVLIRYTQHIKNDI